jgi:DNA excision repair protein ERCC-2
LLVYRFLKIAEFYSEKYISFYEKKETGMTMNLYCLDASHFLRNIFSRIKGAVIFSATLSPIDYFIDTLGGETLMDPAVILPSPFPKENFKLLVAPKVSTKYKDRASTYEIVAEYIENFIKNKKGNYFVYCPSYDYLDNLCKYLKLDDVEVHIQQKEMHDKTKQDFLENFKENPEKTTLGLLVVGGAFGEGIDLVSDRLIGAVVIGIGMPKINFKSDQISAYYKTQEKPGYDYAYIYPGMNKIMQAVGRVIRSEHDRGSVLLIDERYMHRQYQNLFRNEWKHYEVVFSPEEVSKKLEIFYKD